MRVVTGDGSKTRVQVEGTGRGDTYWSTFEVVLTSFDHLPGMFECPV